MPFLFIIFMSLFSQTLFAQAEKLESFDLNQDGVKDRFEYSVKDKIVRVEEDRNGDGKIDFKTILNDKTYYKTEWQDADYDGKNERKKSYVMLANKKTKIITEIDKNEDGTFEIKYESIADNIQKQMAPCETEVSQKIKELSATALKAVSKTDKGLLPTGLGYKVDYECYQKWGDDFNQVVKEVAVGGLQCLMDLDKKYRVGKATTGALRNAFNLTKLMKNDGISLVCSEDQYNWNGTLAHASVAPGEKLESKNISHPFVSIRPSSPQMPLGDREEEVAKFKDTLFHETLHNLGYRHNEDIEIAYTCGACCFDNKASVQLKDKSCKLCTGDYQNETDITYIKDFVEFTRLTYDEARGAAAVQKYLKENPKSISGVAILAYASSGVFSPVGGELSKIVLEKNQTLTETDKKYLLDSQFYNGSPEFQNNQVSSKVLANSLYELYYNKSGSKTVAELEKNKEAIKKEFAQLEQAGGNSKFIQAELNNCLNKIIQELWLNNYPGDNEGGKATSDRAYQLYEYFFPEKK